MDIKGHNPATKAARDRGRQPGDSENRGPMGDHARSRFSAYARFLGQAFRFNLKSAMEYRSNFLLQVFGMALNNAAFAVFWRLVLDRTGNLAGYGYMDIMYLWALASSAFGLAHVVFGNARGIGRMIKEGDLDVFLLQPKDTLLNLTTSRTVVSGWGDVLYGYIVLAVLGSPVQIWAVFTWFTLCGAVIMAALMSLMESLAFWLGGTEGLGNTMVELLLNFSLYPDSVFPSGMRWIFYSLVPTAYIVFIPLGLVKEWNWGIFGICTFMALVYPVLAWVVFNRGIRHYASGNKIGARA